MTLALNASTPLTTPTYDGSGETVHPAVIDAIAATGSIWNGHRYWMAVTPYPSTNDDFEFQSTRPQGARP